MKTPNMAGFVGYKGINIWLEPVQQYEDDLPLVVDRPDLFDDVPAEDDVLVEPAPVKTKGSVKASAVD